MAQVAREKAMAKFREGKVRVLVATDVAARGIDVADVTHVINYSCPEDENTYVHRIGRTGRAGATGIAITFVDWADVTRWKVINKALGLPFEEPAETYSTSEHLFHDLGIPPGTKGRHRRPGARPPRERRARRGDRGGRGGRTGAAAATGRGARAAQPEPDRGRTRSRSRTDSGDDRVDARPQPAPRRAPQAATASGEPATSRGSADRERRRRSSWLGAQLRRRLSATRLTLHADPAPAVRR